jgi:hypothetical protein
VTYPDTLATIMVTPLSADQPHGLSSTAPEILVSPNPAYDHVTLQLPLRHSPGQVTLWNILGQRLRVLSPQGQTLDLDLSAFPAGMYVITMDQRPGWSTRILLLK